MQALAGSHLRIGFVVLLFGLSAGLLEFGVHTAIMQAGVSLRMQAMADASAVGFAAALVPLFVLLAARERHRKLLDDLRKIAQLNHHIRNALQTILYGEYLPASETNRQVVLEGVDRIGRILQELFPVVGTRVDDKKWKIIQMNHIRGFVPDRRNRS
jgi:predicted component of type VI protein secretion system